MTVKLRAWKWGILPVYNGFTHEERVRGWQAIWWMIDSGKLKKPTICSISGTTERVAMHSENYYEPAPYGINQSLHMALHQRFKRPDNWRRIVDQYATTGEEWFAKLMVEPVDLAGDLRRVHGDGIADIFARAPISSGIRVDPT
jgi:hypothetical protein